MEDQWQAHEREPQSPNLESHGLLLSTLVTPKRLRSDSNQGSSYRGGSHIMDAVICQMGGPWSLRPFSAPSAWELSGI